MKEPEDLGPGESTKIGGVTVTNCNTRPFNSCELCSASGQYLLEVRQDAYVSPIQKYTLEQLKHMSIMLCANGHYFKPGRQEDTGKLQQLEHQYYNTSKE